MQQWSVKRLTYTCFRNQICQLRWFILDNNHLRLQNISVTQVAFTENLRKIKILNALNDYIIQKRFSIVSFYVIHPGNQTCIIFNKFICLNTNSSKYFSRCCISTGRSLNIYCYVSKNLIVVPQKLFLIFCGKYRYLISNTTEVHQINSLIWHVRFSVYTRFPSIWGSLGNNKKFLSNI